MTEDRSAVGRAASPAARFATECVGAALVLAATGASFAFLGLLGGYLVGDVVNPQREGGGFFELSEGGAVGGLIGLVVGVVAAFVATWWAAALFAPWGRGSRRTTRAWQVLGVATALVAFAWFVIAQVAANT